MRVLDLVTELNKKVNVRGEHVMRVKKYYLSLYRANMVYLYDRGYISDPTCFDRKEILRNIVDLGIRDLTSIRGVVELNSSFVGYVRYRYKDKEEIYDFLSILYEVLKYREISMNIDKFYDFHGFTPLAKKKVSLNIARKGCRIANKSNLVLDEGVLKCFNTFDKNIDFVSIREVIYKYALEELGLDDTYKDSLFVKGLTREEEIENCDLILNGLVKLDGIYAKKLNAWLKNNKWSENNTLSYQREGLYNWVTIMRSSEIIENQSLVFSEILNTGTKIIGMSTDGFYIERDGDFNYPIGIFSVVSGDEDVLLPEINIAGGYTGEVYSLDYLEENGLHYVGCPIVLYVSARSKEYFVDKEQTEMVDSVSWFKEVGVHITFDGSRYQEGVFLSGSREDILYKLVGEAEDGKLIGVLPEDFDIDCIDVIKKLVIGKL